MILVMNLFLPVYKRLEEDVSKLADTIFFDDNQLSTYSLAIGDLLIRCVIEVEAISKELYLNLGGTEHPTDAKLSIDALCQKLGVNYMSFVNQEIRALGSPFHRLKEKEVVLNKNNGIYPTLTYSDFLDSAEGQKYMEDTVASLSGKIIILPK